MNSYRQDSCEHWQQVIEERIELDPENQVSLEKHLEVCETCRHLHDTDVQISQLCQDIPETASPGAITYRLQQTIRNRRRSPFVWGSAVCILLVMSIVGWNFYPKAAYNSPKSNDTSKKVEDLLVNSQFNSLPPVERLDVLSEQESVILTYLQYIQKDQ